jgi:hypothetical protein
VQERKGSNGFTLSFSVIARDSSSSFFHQYELTVFVADKDIDTFKKSLEPTSVWEIETGILQARKRFEDPLEKKAFASIFLNQKDFKKRDLLVK